MDNEKVFLSVKTKNPDTVKMILNREENIEVDGLNVLEELIRPGQPVFIVLGGDKPAWDTGLIGIGEFSSYPYDKGYYRNNYKAMISVRVLLSRPIKREDLIPYKETYGTIGIGPITKWEPNQALSRVSEKNAVALMHAMAELFPYTKTEIESFAGTELSEKIFAKTNKMVEIPVEFGEEESDALKKYIAKPKAGEERISDEYWPSLDEYNPCISEETWIDIIINDRKNHPETFTMLKTMNDLGGEATCATLGRSLNKHPSAFVGIGEAFGRRVKKELDLPPCMDGDVERFFPIPFVGKNVYEEGMKRYIWRLRPELVRALTIMQEDELPLQEEVDEAYNQRAFELWFKKQIIPQGDSNAGNYYSDNTIKTYVADIKYHKVLINGKEKTLFATRDIEVIDSVLNLPEINSYRTAAVSKYRQFVLENIPSGKATVRYRTGFESVYQMNRIVFGAPGTGKSYTLNQDARLLVGDNDYCLERVTFHPDYSYANFVGTYKPVPAKDDEGKDIITYEYVPGPFMRVYTEALKNSVTEEIKPYLLLIEEINRANVAAVFGDVFQLLDRDESNVSEYPIQATEDMKAYLAKELGGCAEDYATICIPDNMFIWATMNSADQGVFPMDTAFKRRWDFSYIGIDDSDEKIRGKFVILGEDETQKVEWNKLRKAINYFLAENRINEDKQLGPYFLSAKIAVPKDGDEIDREQFIESFKNKVIMYLFEDAGKRIQTKLFEGCSGSAVRYSEICREFDKNGIRIFNPQIQADAEVEIVDSDDE